MGEDIVGRWSIGPGGNGLNEKRVAAGSWVGLYKSKDCTSYDVNIHRCYIASVELPVNATSGVVRFKQMDYKEAGDYDLRYFAGDSRHGQGVVCRGLRRIPETYLQCALQAVVTSPMVYVDPEEPAGSGSEAESMGFEAVFDQGDEAYDVDAVHGMSHASLS